MYVLPNSLLEQVGEYRIEVYTMTILKHNAMVDVDLKILGEGEIETYMADYEITKSDGKTLRGSCLNYGTKEQTILAVEEVAMWALDDKERIWE